ncbi:MAG TPA: hypothetical protein P5230_03450 [Candidatus Magasanikbacteria bacterium]|nr:hypothetical protein [Candidatus Magasanikbacteria bacterium]
MEENTTTNSNPQPYAFDLQSDSSGNWDLMIDKSLSEGPHVIMVEDEYGNTDEALIYILKQETTPTSSENFGLIDRVTNVVPAISTITIWVLVLLVAVAAINMVRLARKADAEAMGFPRQTRYFGINVIIAMLLVGAALFAGLFFNFKLGYFKIVKDAPELILNKVSGQLIDPLTLQGVKADLSSGDTVVKTSASGYFVFNKVKSGEGIYLTHPNLKKAVILSLSSKQNDQLLSWYFSPDMYNLLISVMDAEARGKFGDIYKNLPNDVQNKIDNNKFISAYKTILAPNNVEDQNVVITNISVVDNWKSEKYDLLFPKVYSITISANKKTDTYYLISEEEKWKIMK